MTTPLPVLLLPGPASAAAARELLGEVYEYQSYLTDDYASDSVAFHANGHLKPLSGRRVDVWPIPPRRRPAALGAESIIRQLLKLKCTVRVIAIAEDDEQYEPRACQLIGMARTDVLAWARARIKPIETMPEEVPRETPVKRGRPRSTPDGAPPAAEQIDGNTGSVFISWERLGLAVNSNGAPFPNLANVQRCLVNHPDIAGRIWYDEFHNRIFQSLFQPEPQEWADYDDTRLTIWLQTTLRLEKIGRQTVQHAVEEFARHNVRCEPKEWLERLLWDRTPRLHTLLADAFGTPQDDYHAAVARCWFVSLVARIYEPGCKVDYMPVFEGWQGLKKTSALEAIGGKWFAELHEDINKKDFFLALQGKLLVEFTELHQFTRSDIERIKGIITCRIDRYRSPFGRHTADHPRRSVFAGTTNRDDWVTDDTGARRFWPVACGIVNVSYLRDQRDQLFAEAAAIYHRSPINSSVERRIQDESTWWAMDWGAAEQQQDLRRDTHPWYVQVREWIQGREGFTMEDLFEFAIQIPIEKRDMAMQKQMAGILRQCGYTRRIARVGAQVRRTWYLGKRTGNTIGDT